ncbi:MAG: alpha/beta fold hydrolase [Hyphomonadaceae bacterium]|nr:alpha/beta fold hydrolase [Hyphomonadaceae bacterium]
MTVKRLLLSSSLLTIALAGCVSIDVTETLSAETADDAPSVEAIMEPAADNNMRVEVGNLVMEGIPEIPTDVKERLRQYQNVRGHGFQDWTEDGILISTRFGEVSQIHQVTTPLGARKQITFYPEPIGGASAAPDGKSFVFAKDTGGDEFYQAFLYDMETGATQSFTEPGTRNGSFVWSDDGTLGAWYQATDGDPDYDILIGDPSDPSSTRVLFEGEGAVFTVDFSPEADQLVVQRYISITKSQLFVLDVQTGEATEINPDDDVAYNGALLLSDGTLLSSTDKGSDFKNLVRINPETGEETVYTAEINWDVAGYDISPDESTVAFTLNEGGLGTIKLLDLTTGEISDGPALPVGIVGGVTFHPDGEQIGFTFSAATSPADAWSANIKTGELTRWTTADVGGMDTSGFAEPELFTYPNYDDMQIPAFVYRPEGDGPHPVIVSIHGGPEGQARPSFSSTYQYWVNELGAAVVVPNVRGSSGYGKTYVSLDNGLNRKKSVEDIGALLDWIETQPDLDKDRIVVFGGSYGGYMVLASMIDYADRVAAGVNIVGISDFKTFLTNTKGYRRDLRRAEYGDERDPEIAAFFDEISPLRNADKITKPIFIIQGLNDPRVPASEAEQILAAVRENEGTAWYLLAKDEGHGFRKKSNRDFQREAETMFFEKVFNGELE